MKNKLFRAVQVGTSVFSALVLSAQLVAVHASNINVPVQVGQGYASDLGSIINFGLQVVMVIALLLVFGFLIMGGIEWITSGGEKSKTESARNKITSAVIGLIVLAAAYAVFTLMLHFLGFQDITTAINGVTPINGSSGGVTCAVPGTNPIVFGHLQTNGSCQ